MDKKKQQRERRNRICDPFRQYQPLKFQGGQKRVKKVAPAKERILTPVNLAGHVNSKLMWKKGDLDRTSGRKLGFGGTPNEPKKWGGPRRA